MSGSGSSSGGGTIILARKKADGNTAYATITDDHLTHLIRRSQDDELTSKLSSLRDSEDD
jgi:hypothetical protein